jgi:hypothetical protein
MMIYPMENWSRVHAMIPTLPHGTLDAMTTVLFLSVTETVASTVTGVIFAERYSDITL